MTVSAIVIKAVGVIILLTLFVVGNLFFSTRDGAMTIGQESFQPQEVVTKRLWTESPMQILHTHMADSTRFIGVGKEGQGGLPFADRLVASFGSDQVNQNQEPFDLRGLPKSSLDRLELFVERFSYRSMHACPHEPSLDCTIAIGWNRERTKAKDMLIVSTRIGDSLYLLVDESIVNISKGER